MIVRQYKTQCNDVFYLAVEGLTGTLGIQVPLLVIFPGDLGKGVGLLSTLRNRSRTEEFD